MSETIQNTSQTSAHEKRQLLIRLLSQAIREGHSNLTPEQQRLWFLQRLGATIPLHVFQAFDMYGVFEAEQFQASIDTLIATHDLLRTSFVDLEGHPIRLILPVVRLAPNIVDVSSQAADDQHMMLQRLALQIAQQPFSLEEAPLLRITVVHLSAGHHVVLIAMHQIIADETSITILMRQLAEQYAGRLSGETPPQPEQAVPFAHLAAQLQEAIQQGAFSDHLRAWREKLVALQPLTLPLDHPRPVLKSYNGQHIRREVPVELVERLEDLRRRPGISLHVIVAAAFNALLARFTQFHDIALGLLMDERQTRSLPTAIGPLTNVLVLRTDLSGDPSFRELLERVRIGLEQVLAIGDVPFQTLVEDLQPPRDSSRTPLCQVTYGERVARETFSAAALRLLPRWMETGIARFDATLVTERHDRRLFLEIEFNTDLFKASTIEGLLDQLQVLLEGIGRDIDQPISAIPLLTEQHRHDLLVTWNQTTRALDDPRCVHEHIADQASRAPDAVAVIAGDRTMTFAELEQRANQIAGRLRAYDVGPEQLVVVCCERSLDVPLALLGVLKAGGAYVPIDPGYPDERIAFIIRDTAPRMIITERKLYDRLIELLPGPPGHADPAVICLDDLAGPAGAPGPLPSALEATLGNLAYVIYTSGSTGQPKGVMITHRGLLNYLAWAVQAYEVVAGEGVPLASSISFDLTVTSVFPPLMAGRPLTLIAEQDGIEALGNALSRGPQYSLVKITPAHLEILSQQIPPHAAASCTRCFVIGGEQMHYNSLKLWRAHAPATRLINEYGPTETVVGCCTYQVQEDDPDIGPVPIGRPIANTRLYVLDDRMRLLPSGVAGELYIGGAGVARGYLNRPGLTAERFVPDPFAGTPGERLYKTGDSARYRPDGTLEFLGRLDRQVKVRGFRIELGEIEAVLLQHTNVTQAVVEVVPDGTGDLRLVAYVVLENQAVSTPDELIAFLGKKLPSYMVPTWVVALDRFPQTANRKIDRLALPRPDVSSLAEQASEAPASPLEDEIAKVVTLMLDISSIGRNASIFDYGASSLMIARLSARLSTHYAIDPSIHEMFREPTIAGLARMVEQFRERHNQPSSATWEWEAERIEAEAQLDESITPAGLPTANYLDPAHVFLTGATGYLGAFLLDTLLRRTNATVHCLIRARNTDRAMERLKRNLQQYRLWDESYISRIRLVCGDLGKPLLDLSPDAFTRLAESIDAIYHSGALVNFTYPYDALKKPNVQGTQELLRLACHTTRKAFHYLSTLDVFLMSSAPRPFLEVDLPRQSVMVPDGYPRTKWVSEKMVVIARDRGLPVINYRPGFLIGHTQTGACATTNYIVVALKGFLQLGVFPELNDILNIAPVDYAAEAVVHLGGKPNTYGKHYHLWNLAPVQFRETYPWVRSFGYDFEVAPYREVHERLLQVEPDHPIYPILPLLDLNSEFDELPETSLSPHIQATIDLEAECANTSAGLRGSGISCPPMSEAMVHQCLAYLVDIGYLPPPPRGR